ncbi:hypothetical protein CIHG_04351 [Coccidioides immitis H538.4]|uniref:Uncharacterized protein n=2 Tax=Coccidioides immitis TaxID=5501 RepID=A0A0J8RP17_COCIT|nr:hypothetical protein CIRG_09284 [Coccidioides immitis RMSCC 2394]KMU86562.1 hypothetical protein CIHG_04351 [Coccidioides immitis H538.4]
MSREGERACACVCVRRQQPGLPDNRNGQNSDARDLPGDELSGDGWAKKRPVDGLAGSSRPIDESELLSRDCLGTTGRKDIHARHNYTLSIPVCIVIHIVLRTPYTFRLGAGWLAALAAPHRRIEMRTAPSPPCHGIAIRLSELFARRTRLRPDGVTPNVPICRSTKQFMCTTKYPPMAGQRWPFVSSPETQNIRRRWGWRLWNQQRISGVEAPELQKWTQFLPPSANDLDSTYGQGNNEIAESLMQNFEASKKQKFCCGVSLWVWTF